MPDLTNPPVAPRRARALPALALGGSLLLTATLLGPAGAAYGATGSTTSAALAQTLVANLRGGEEADPNGRGRATFRIFPAQRRVCATVTWRRIGTPTAAHIHRNNGMVAVDLTGSVTAGARCALMVPRPLIRRILDHPRRFYFNVHNEKYPAGAISGRLHR